MTSLRTASVYERFWTLLTAWASRNLKRATDLRRRAQIEQYRRQRALHPSVSDMTINQMEEEDEFFG